MPANTPILNLPYPLDSDRINVAIDIEHLAEAIEARLTNVNSPFFTDLDARYVNVAGDSMAAGANPGMISVFANPTSDNHLVRRIWVDSNYLARSGNVNADQPGGRMTGPLYLDDVDYTGPNIATRREWQLATFLQLGTTATQHLGGGDIDMNQGAIFDLKDPTGANTQEAATSHWVNLHYLRNDANAILTGGSYFQAGVGPPSDAPSARLDSSGYLSSSVNTAGSPNLVLRRGNAADAVGQTYISFQRPITSSAEIGRVHIGPDQTHVNYATSSDHRLKERDGPITDAGARVVSLADRAYRGHWKEGTSGLTYDFLNAHDVADVAPYAVSGEKDAVDDYGKLAAQMVDYGQLVPLLVAALGDALARIAVLEAAA